MIVTCSVIYNYNIIVLAHGTVTNDDDVDLHE